MARLWRGTLKGKILLSAVLCFLLVGLPSFFLLFSHMNRLVYMESAEAGRARMEDAVESVSDELSAVIDAVAWICSDESVRDALAFESQDSPGAGLAVIQAQASIATYMSASPAGEHLNKLVLFRPGSGMCFEFVSQRYGNLLDLEKITESEEFRTLEFPQGAVVRLFLSRTINSPEGTALTAYGRIRDSSGYVYAEISPTIFDKLFTGTSEGRGFIYSDNTVYPGPIPQDFLDSSKWDMDSYDLPIPGCSVVQFIDRTPFRIASAYGLAVFVAILATSTILVILLSALLSRYLTKSASRLVGHIEYLTDTSDFGFVDKDIEEGDDEIAAIGRTVNAMSVSISELLERNEKLFEEKKRMEMDMLQLQVNPHFLYNTLESIRYLAEIQKDDGIARMSRGLTTLLRNLAKGSSDMIPLSQELDLLKEYDEIQQVRYMGMYEIRYAVPDEMLDILIQKFTLQPLVENAIFHGIEPTGRDGTITISARSDGEDAVITVMDDGVGMTDEEIANVFAERKHSKSNMTGIGVRNINERIRLRCGEGYGLSFEADKGRYTKAIIRIKAERDVQDSCS